MKHTVLLVKIDKSAGGSQNLSFSEPIGICYLSAYLKKNGVDCHLLHIIQGDDVQDKINAAITDTKATFVGFSVRNFNFQQTCTCMREIRSAEPAIELCIGGECITEENIAELLQKSNGDFAIISDGEESLLALLTGKDKDSILGVAYRDALTGKCIYNPLDNKRVNPAELPMMDRRDLPMSAYQATAFQGKKYATMHVQRGCRYRCTFCHTACRYSRSMSRTHTQIIDEIDDLCKHHGIEALAIWDEDFFSDVERVKNIANALIERGSPVEWHTFMKLTDLKASNVKELLPILQKSRYARAVIGIESFIPDTLRRYRKVGGPNIGESLQVLTDHKIKISPAYIIGEPHETKEDITYGLRHLQALKDSGIDMDFPYISFLTPFPGTPLYDEYNKRGLLSEKNWDKYDGEHVVVKCKCPTKTMIKLRNKFFQHFYGE